MLSSCCGQPYKVKFCCGSRDYGTFVSTFTTSGRTAGFGDLGNYSLLGRASTVAKTLASDVEHLGFDRTREADWHSEEWLCFTLLLLVYLVDPVEMTYVYNNTIHAHETACMHFASSKYEKTCLTQRALDASTPIVGTIANIGFERVSEYDGMFTEGRLAAISTSGDVQSAM